MSERLAIVVSHPIQHFCPQYSSWAKRSGVELKVFFSSTHGLNAYEDKSFGRTVKWDGICLNFEHEFLPGAESRAICSATDSTALEERLSLFKPSHIVIYGYSQRLQRRALRWAERFGVSVLMISDSELHGRRNRLKQAIKSLILPRIFRKVSAFLTVGDANEAYYRSYGVQDQRLIRCSFPIDTNLYNSVLANRDESRNRVRIHLGIPAHHKVLLMVGKLVPWKRQADLVRFSNAIHSKRNDVTVLLAGTGPDEAFLRELTVRHGLGGVIFGGFVQPEILAEYYCAADVYVHCSEREPHSLAISEAIYSGLPIVLSHRCGSYGPMDDVRPGLNGFVYRCGDIDDLSRVLLHAIGEGIRNRMSQASLRIGQEHQKLAHGDALEQALEIIKMSKLQ